MSIHLSILLLETTSNAKKISKELWIHTTPAAPAVIAIGAVTALSPDEHMTGIFTARDMEYAAAKVGVAYNNDNAQNKGWLCMSVRIEHHLPMPCDESCWKWKIRNMNVGSS